MPPIRVPSLPWHARPPVDEYERGRRSRDGEVDALRERAEAAERLLGRLQRHLTRMERVQRGLPEAPRAPRPAAQAWTDDLRAWVAGYESPVAAEHARLSIEARLAAGEEPKAILADLKGE